MWVFPTLQENDGLIGAWLKPFCVGHTRFDFLTKKQFSLPFHNDEDDDRVDDHELVEGVDGDDDRGVTVPGQVDGVCRYPL